MNSNIPIWMRYISHIRCISYISDIINYISNISTYCHAHASLSSGETHTKQVKSHTRCFTMSHDSHTLNYHGSCLTHFELQWVMFHTCWMTMSNVPHTNIPKQRRDACARGHVSFICMTWLMCLSYVWHDSCVFHMRDMTQKSLFICVTWLMCHDLYTWHDSCVIIYMYDMTHASSSIHVTQLLSQAHQAGRVSHTLNLDESCLRNFE